MTQSYSRQFRESLAPLIAAGAMFDMADILDRERELERWCGEMAAYEEMSAARGDLLKY